MAWKSQAHTSLFYCFCSLLRSLLSLPSSICQHSLSIHAEDSFPHTCLLSVSFFSLKVTWRQHLEVHKQKRFSGRASCTSGVTVQKKLDVVHADILMWLLWEFAEKLWGIYQKHCQKLVKKKKQVRTVPGKTFHSLFHVQHNESEALPAFHLAAPIEINGDAIKFAQAVVPLQRWHERRKFYRPDSQSSPVGARGRNTEPLSEEWSRLSPRSG